MTTHWEVLVAHAPTEEKIAEQLAQPIRDAGYGVTHLGSVLVGDSVVEAMSKEIQKGGPVVLCGTVQAVGTGWAHKLINAARVHSGTRVFIVQVEKDAYVQQLSFGDVIADYWRDPGEAMSRLIRSIQAHYPISDASPLQLEAIDEAERRYRELALESCDIIDLANLPESDRHIATRKLELRRLYVPLRVRIEVPVGEPEEAALKALEATRAGTTFSHKLQVALRRKERMSSKQRRVPVGERLGKARRLIVLGHPGSGKSTIVRWIATAYLLRLKRESDWRDLPDVATLPDEDWLPVVIRCRDLDVEAADWTLENTLRHVLRKAEMIVPQIEALGKSLRMRLEQGRALLLIDGLDEIADSVKRAQFVRQIEQIHVAYPLAPIVVTSRIVGYRELNLRIGRGFEHLTVDDLLPADKDDFAFRWSDLTELPERRATAAQELIRDIHSTARIELLTGNPMLLTTLALVKRKVGKLPRRRADLYWEAVQVLLNWRSEVDEPIDSREALPQLEYLAYGMCEQGVQQLRQDQLIEYLEKMREDYPRIYSVRDRSPAEFLALLERRTGIIVEAGYVRHQGELVPVYEFRHLTFQEYLAALALVRGRYPGRDRSVPLGEHIRPLAGKTGQSELWRETLRLCVACSNDDEVDNLLEAIITPSGERDASSRAMLGALCLADEPNVSESIVRAALSALADQTPVGRPRPTAQELREVATCRWAPELFAILFERLSKSHGEHLERIADFYASLLASRSPAPRGETLNWIEPYISDAASEHTRTAVESFLWLARLARGGRAAVPPEFTGAVVQALSAGHGLAYCASMALFYIKTSSRAVNLWRLKDDELEALAGKLSDASGIPESSQFIITVLGVEGYVASAPQVAAHLSSSDLRVRLVAAETVAKFKAEPELRKLIPLLSDENEKIRIAAIKGTSVLGDDYVKQKLLEMATGNPSYKVRLAAISQLPKTHGEVGVSVLLRLLPEAQGQLALAIIEALDSIELANLVSALAEKKFIGKKVKKAAITAAVAARTPAAIELLTRLSADSNVKIATMAVGKLRAILPTS